MSTGNLSLDILLNEIKNDVLRKRTDSVKEIAKRFPSLSEKEANEVYQMVCESLQSSESERTTLIATAPPMFDIKVKSTINTVGDLVNQAKRSILITGYSLSEYFSEAIDTIIRKSQSGVFVKFFVNKMEDQQYIGKLRMYKGKFLRIYDYPQNANDVMAALHAKVILIDKQKTLVTSANLSYHGQEANIEMGALVESQVFAKQVEDFFTQLVFKKIFVEV